MYHLLHLSTQHHNPPRSSLGRNTPWSNRIINQQKMIPGRAVKTLSIQRSHFRRPSHIQPQGVIPGSQVPVKKADNYRFLTPGYRNQLCLILWRIDQGNRSGGVKKSSHCHTGAQAGFVNHNGIRWNDKIHGPVWRDERHALAAAFSGSLWDVLDGSCYRD